MNSTMVLVASRPLQRKYSGDIQIREGNNSSTKEVSLYISDLFHWRDKFLAYFFYDLLIPSLDDLIF